MKLKDEILIQAPRETVFAALNDPDVLTEAIPGCQTLEKISDNEFTATVVTNGTRMYVNHTGNAALATAGSGDILTGLIAALIAQGMAPFEAAALGVHLHGRSGDLWCKQYGPAGLTARDLADLLPQAIHEARRPAR